MVSERLQHLLARWYKGHSKCSRRRTREDGDDSRRGEREWVPRMEVDINIDGATKAMVRTRVGVEFVRESHSGEALELTVEELRIAARAWSELAVGLVRRIFDNIFCGFLNRKMSVSRETTMAFE